MKNVLIVMTSLYNGGAERSLVNFLNEIPSDKYNIDLLLFKKGGMFLKQIPEYVNVLDVPEDLKKLYGPLSRSKNKFGVKLFGNFISRLKKYYPTERRSFRWKNFYSKSISKLEKKYDVALAYISGEILYYVDEKVDADKKIVWIHNDYKSARHSREIDYEHLKNMNAIVSISESCVNILKKEFPEFSDKIYLIENITSSVVLAKRANEFFPKEFNDDGIKLLSIGRLSKQKGFDIAIDAAKILVNKNINFKWYIIGSGELKKELEKKIRVNKLERNVILLGAIDNPYPYIKNCTIFVQPSRFEGKSVVLDEAKILAAPIVVTNYPTVHDQIKENKEGIIAELNAEGLATVLDKVISNESIRDELIENLKHKNYGNQDEVEKYLKIIDE